MTSEQIEIGKIFRARLLFDVVHRASLAKRDGASFDEVVELLMEQHPNPIETILACAVLYELSVGDAHRRVGGTTVWARLGLVSTPRREAPPRGVSCEVD